MTLIDAYSSRDRDTEAAVSLMNHFLFVVSDGCATHAHTLPRRMDSLLGEESTRRRLAFGLSPGVDQPEAVAQGGERRSQRHAALTHGGSGRCIFFCPCDLQPAKRPKRKSEMRGWFGSRVLFSESEFGNRKSEQAV